MQSFILNNIAEYLGKLFAGFSSQSLIFYKPASFGIAGFATSEYGSSSNDMVL